ncbi:DNA-binding protein [Deinococcus sp. SDU3-2]|uniref:DNA-binding protein n=1 Tax=Deinococcus terrestris TaxID=2651870 RepID=A0A7X1NSW6_9DEIO|nr:DNA-binding protein [Deinococcus terrestris]MPY65161.1 DNA-binding protein [Deinococcus terrestris]
MTELPKLGAPARRALSDLGITRLEDLTAYTPAQIRTLHGVGPRVMQRLQASLTANGLNLKSHDRERENP